MVKSNKRIGILTGGGDCPGLNAAIRAIVKAAQNDYNMDILGIKDGFEGLIENRYFEINPKNVSGILATGGTILGTSNRADPFNFPVLQEDDYIFIDRSSEAVKNFEKLGLDALIAIGGDGTMTASAGMAKKGLPIVGVPKTIDNDLDGTDATFGFDSAMVSATEAIDKIHTTAQSHHRVMIVEVMGRFAGWLALHSGIAGGGDIILMPEFPYDINAVCEKIRHRNAIGKNFSIVVIGEGARPIGGNIVVAQHMKTSPEKIRLGGISHKLAEQIEKIAGIECRVTILGHLLRGGAPSPYDRILATRFGVAAVHLVAEEQYGRMVSLKNNKMTSIPIHDVAGKMRLITVDNSMIKTALSLGICLGNPVEQNFEDFYKNFSDEFSNTDR
jgi:6-phosphofructokinase 1